MTIEEAYNIIEEYEDWERGDCYCNAGNAPCCHCESQPSSEEDYDEALLLIEKYEEESEPMHPTIIAMFPKTEDAVLVQKHFGERIASDILSGVVLAGKEVELLEEAKLLEKKEAAKS